MFTYNVNKKDPTGEVKASMINALGLSVTNPNGLPDIYAIGLQESPESHIPHGRLKNKPDQWSEFLTTLLAGYGYTKVDDEKLVQIKLLIFAKKNIANKITDVETNSHKTGLKGMYGNKGGVAIRMTINGSHICFLSCHLAAFDEKLQQRISDYKNIVFKIKFKNSFTPDILSHE